jgi:cytochrome c peroxidase
MSQRSLLWGSLLWALPFGAAPLLGCAFEAAEKPPEEEMTPLPDLPEDVLTRLQALSPAELPATPEDITNAYADDPKAALFGQRLFFDPGFSGPLLDDDNDGAPETLGMQGDTGKVSCASCHLPGVDFLDQRSTRRQISLASSWTRRRTPSLLDMGQATILTWDGRRDTAYGQVFGVIESPAEFNSSRLFAAQRIASEYREEYESIFGPLPSLDAYEELAAADAGCAELPTDLAERCPKPGQDDADVIRVVANMGKALGAYQRQLECGTSRFDAWLHGDLAALNAEEQAGAVLFIRSGCDNCHSGPYMTDQAFYNLGVAHLDTLFIEPFDDPGASIGLAAVQDDILNSRGEFSDGDDGRLDNVPEDTSGLEGAFRTPGLRCVGRRPTYMHAGQMRSLEDVVLFFNRGGDNGAYLGTKDPIMVPLGLTQEQRGQLVAFLRTLDGPGADAALLGPPQ